MNIPTFAADQKILMRKLIMLLLGCGSFCVSIAQDQTRPDQSKDTTARLDSSILDEIKDNVLDNIPVISLDDNDQTDVNSQNISSVLTAGRDPFFSAAAFAELSISVYFPLSHISTIPAP